MSVQDKMKEAEELLTSRYGIDFSDVNPAWFQKFLEDGEEVEALVEECAVKFGLERIDGLNLWNSRN
jgi:hypothetical protein